MRSNSAYGFANSNYASPTAAQMIEVLAGYTAFPQALLAAVCERQRLDVATLAVDEVPALIHAIALQIALFNEVDDGFAVKRKLLLALHGRY